MCDGQRTIGTILVRSAKEFVAIGSDGTLIGNFGDQRSAMKAISVAYGGAYG
jgi:hypothetical protein